MVTKRYGLVFALLLVMALVLVAPAGAFVCFGKIGALACSGPAQGTCISTDWCLCNSSNNWGGNECQTPLFCGTLGNFCNSTKGLCTINGSSGTCFCGDGRTGMNCGLSTPGTLIPSAPDFGSTSVGSTVTGQSAIIYTSPLQMHNMTVNIIALGGANSGDFGLGSGTCMANTNVTGAGNCTIPVSFTPTATGTRSATLTITTMEPDGTNPQTLTTTLTGTGTIAVSSLLVDPVTPSILFAGLDGAGIYRSTTSGGSWLAATLAPVTMRIKALVIRPGDSTKLFAATYGGGVYRSTDSGVSWSACANTGLANLNVLSLVSDSSGKLYAGTEAGVYTSPDCDTWTAQNAGLPS